MTYINRHVMQCTLNPHLISYVAPCDVASIIRQALDAGEEELAAAAAELRRQAGAYTRPLLSSS
jgi:hypothetical protein